MNNQNRTIILQELNLQEMNKIKGGFPMGVIINGLCVAVEADIYYNWHNWSLEQEQEALEFYAAFCID